jgi:NADH-quinone oxidoreductase subunit G
VRNDILGTDSVLPEGSLACVLPVTDTAPTVVAGNGLQRIADVPIYFADPLVRRSPSLQKTRDAQAPVARMSAATLAGIGAADGRSVRVKGSEGAALLNAVLDNTVPDGCVRIAAAHPSTATIGALNDMIVVECV